MVETCDREEMIQRVSAAIAGCSGALITLSSHGCPRARLLEDHNPYPGFEFWFATHTRTRKVPEIEAHPQVCILYQPPSMGGYICIMGQARIRRDEEGRRYIWREGWAQYYGDPMAAEFVPIQVIPGRVEYYDTKTGAHDDDGFGPVVVEL